MSEPRPSRSTGRLSPPETALLIIGAVLVVLSVYLYSRTAAGPLSEENKSRKLATAHSEENANALADALNAYFLDNRGYPAFLVGGHRYERPSDPLIAGGYLEDYPLRAYTRSHRIFTNEHIRNLYVPRGTELFETLALQARPAEPPKPHEPTPPTWMSSLVNDLPPNSPYHAFSNYEPLPASLVRESPVVISIRLYLCPFVHTDAHPQIERLVVNGTWIDGKVRQEDDHFLIRSEPFKPAGNGFQHIYLTIDDMHEYYRYRYVRTWGFTYDTTASEEDVQERNGSPAVLDSMELQLEKRMMEQMERNTEDAELRYERNIASRKEEKEKYEKSKEEYPAKVAEYEKRMVAYQEKLQLWQKLNQVPVILCAGGVGSLSSGEQTASRRFAYSMLPKGPEAVFAGTGRGINAVQTPHGHFGYARGDSVAGEKETALFWMYGEAPSNEDEPDLYAHPEPFGLDVLNAETGELVPDGIPDGVVLFCKLQNGEVAEITRAEESGQPSS